MTVRLIVFLAVKGPDEEGKHTFWGFWARESAPGGVHGQIFVSNLNDHAANAVNALDGGKRTVKVFKVEDFVGGEDAAMRQCENMVRASVDGAGA